MKFQHPLFFRAASVSATWTIRRLLGSTRFHFRFADPLVNPAVARRTGQRFIYAFFHEVWLFPAYYWSWPEMQILVSDSRDGDLSAQIMQRLGFGVIRGSTTRGGARALREMQRRVDRGHLCMTPDGPRGPRRTVQQGLVYLASRTGLPIVGAGMAFRDPWRLGSWDQFAVPKPFRAAACVVPQAVYVPSDADRNSLEECRREVESRMQVATIEAERWVEQL
jgi:lysophospholipid acyltransferase (LPLAT)-like uncharacterized protein